MIQINSPDLWVKRFYENSLKVRYFLNEYKQTDKNVGNLNS